jgi:AcrR family transcriptional regulator
MSAKPPAKQASRPRAGTRGIPRAERERQMLEVARRTFAERDYHAVSMEEIAAAVDVSKPMLYAYFGSKEGLFLAAIEHATQQIKTDLEAAVAGDVPPEERLWRAILAVFTFIEESGEAWAILYPGGPLSSVEFPERARRSNEAMAALLTRLLTETAVEQGVDPEVAKQETEPMAEALVGAVEGLASWWLRHPEQPKELQALRFMNLTWMGLGNVVEGRLWEPPVG